MPTVVSNDVKASEVPCSEWLKPFEAKWTWRKVLDAKTESEAQVVLKNWVHRGQAEEVVNEMLEGMRQVEKSRALEWLEELRQPWQYVRRQSTHGKDLVKEVHIKTLEGIRSFTTKALIDSGCTGSAMNCSFVAEHKILTHDMAAPIPVYNVDGTMNQAGAITAYTEVCIIIRDYAEHIDLAVTDLGNKQIFLEHDWLARHNPCINWKTRNMMFARCQCRKVLFELPDVDPKDRCDEELEEGETILVVDVSQALYI